MEYRGPSNHILLRPTDYRDAPKLTIHVVLDMNNVSIDVLKYICIVKRYEYIYRHIRGQNHDM